MGFEEHQNVTEDVNPVALELNRLQNLLKEKDSELGVAKSEIKALKATEALKDKALDELRSEVIKLDGKVRVTENLLEQKNVETKKLLNEKKDAFAAQYAAEAALRRVYTNQKDNNSVPIDSLLAPLEAEIKMYKNEVQVLQEDNKALERLIKSKESALLEAERILKSALERVLIVEEVQNHNFELKRQIEICLEENRILEKTNRQKVTEVEKLSQTIHELEEAILAGGAAANAIRDYKRQIEELNDEKRTLERELARIKVSASRAATVVANEWKDENDRVMPVKQWLEERRFLQAEMQRLRDKLSVSDRTAKAEAQLKEKLKLRLKTLEDGLKQVPSFPSSTNTLCRTPKTEKSNNILGFLTSNGGLKKRSMSQPRGSSISKSSILQSPNREIEKDGLFSGLNRSNNAKRQHAFAQNGLRRSIWTSRSKVVDNGEEENTKMKGNTENSDDKIAFHETAREDDKLSSDQNNEDTVSGFLYDRLQKEVINLRKLLDVKDTNLIAKDEEVKMLMKKVDALTKAIEVESKKMKREMAAREKEAEARKNDEKKSAKIMQYKRQQKAY